MQNKPYYQYYFLFSSPETAKFVEQQAKPFGVECVVDGCSMYFFDEESFDYVSYHYIMKMGFQGVEKKSFGNGIDLSGVREAYVCIHCEGVYPDSPVTQCDCLEGTGHDFKKAYLVDEAQYDALVEAAKQSKSVIK